MKLTKEQLDKIKNAKTKEEALKEYAALHNLAYDAYKKIATPAYDAYLEVYQPAFDAYRNWKPPKPDYHNMTKAKLIRLLKEKDE